MPLSLSFLTPLFSSDSWASKHNGKRVKPPRKSSKSPGHTDKGPGERVSATRTERASPTKATTDRHEKRESPAIFYTSWLLAKPFGQNAAVRGKTLSQKTVRQISLCWCQKSRHSFFWPQAPLDLLIGRRSETTDDSDKTQKPEPASEAPATNNSKRLPSCLDRRSRLVRLRPCREFGSHLQKPLRLQFAWGISFVSRIWFSIVAIGRKSEQMNDRTTREKSAAACSDNLMQRTPFLPARYLWRLLQQTPGGPGRKSRDFEQGCRAESVDTVAEKSVALVLALGAPGLGFSAQLF